MKRIIALVLCVMCFAAVMAGCGSKTNDEDMATVRVWTSDAGGKVVWEELVNDFNDTTGKEKGIKIDWVTYSSDFQTSLEVARKNGQLPEIAAVSDVSGYSKTGDVLPLEDMPGGKEFIEQYDTVLVQGRNVIGDKVYNVPASSNVPGLVYNKDLFKEVGLVDENGEALPPATWEEVREYAKKLTNPEKQVYGIGIPLKDVALYCNYMLRTSFASSFGEMAVYDFDEITVNYDNYKYPFEWSLKIKEDNTMFPGAEGLDNDTMRAYFAAGKIGMFMGLSWDVGVLTDQFEASCDWGVAPCPLVEGMERQPNWRDISGSYTICKSANDMDLEKVMEVYKFIFSMESRKKIYENGIRISCKKDAIEAADKTNIPKQFNEFASLLDESFKVIVPPSVKLEGDVWTDVFSKVWIGSLSVDEAIEDINTRYTNAFKQGVENGSIDPTYYK